MKCSIITVLLTATIVAAIVHHAVPDSLPNGLDATHGRVENASGLALTSRKGRSDLRSRARYFGPQIAQMRHETFNCPRTSGDELFKWLHFVSPRRILSGARALIQAISNTDLRCNDERALCGIHFCGSRQRRGVQGFVGVRVNDGAGHERSRSHPN
jgi:hypothetical protein